MITADRGTWLKQVFTLRGTALLVVWKRVLTTTLIAIAVTILQDQYQVFDTNLTPLPFSLIGLALSIYLGFRNNSGYDRFWEGRKLWGRLVNVSRSFARQVQTLVRNPDGDSSEVHRRLMYMHIAYVHSVRHHLRDEDALAELAELIPAALLEELRPQLNRPAYLANRLGHEIREVYDQGWIHPMHLPVLEASLTECLAIQGACERIKTTPIPFSYTALTHRIVLIYCIGLPFGIVDTIHAMTPIVVMIVAYAFYGLDAVGTEIENPFDQDPNDLPLSALSRMIEVNIRQALGETEFPPLLKPEKGVLH